MRSMDVSHRTLGNWHVCKWSAKFVLKYTPPCEAPIVIFVTGSFQFWKISPRLLYWYNDPAQKSYTQKENTRIQSITTSTLTCYMHIVTKALAKPSINFTSQSKNGKQVFIHFLCLIETSSSALKAKCNPIAAFLYLSQNLKVKTQNFKALQESGLAFFFPSWNLFSPLLVF